MLKPEMLHERAAGRAQLCGLRALKQPIVIFTFVSMCVLNKTGYNV